MKKMTKFMTAVCLTMVVGTMGMVPAAAQASEQLVTRGSQAAAYAGPAEFFTGSVTVRPLFGDYEGAPYGGAYVTFSAGARSNWHTHPAGQRLLVINGTCWTQTWDGQKTVAHAGDSIWCPKDIKHWHGASPDGEMTHLALTHVDEQGKNVTWLEAVSDEQYHSK